jgi:hypothetical protein
LKKGFSLQVLRSGYPPNLEYTHPEYRLAEFLQRMNLFEQDLIEPLPQGIKRERQKDINSISLQVFFETGIL